MKINSTRIEILLAEMRMTKTALAVKSGISRQNISTICKRGTCEPITVGKIAKALGVDPAEIVAREE